MVRLKPAKGQASHRRGRRERAALMGPNGDRLGGLSLILCRFLKTQLPTRLTIRHLCKPVHTTGTSRRASSSLRSLVTVSQGSTIPRESISTILSPGSSTGLARVFLYLDIGRDERMRAA